MKQLGLTIMLPPSYQSEGIGVGLYSTINSYLSLQLVYHFSAAPSQLLIN